MNPDLQPDDPTRWGILVDALRLSTLQILIPPRVGWISAAHPPEDMARVAKRRVDKRSASTKRHGSRRQA